MNKNIKSLLWSLSLILVYFYATKGIVSLFWNCSDKNQFDGRVMFLIYLHIFISLIVIIIPYHILGPQQVDPLYKGIIIYHVLFVTTGIASNILLKER